MLLQVLSSPLLLCDVLCEGGEVRQDEANGFVVEITWVFFRSHPHRVPFAAFHSFHTFPRRDVHGPCRAVVVNEGVFGERVLYTNGAGLVAEPSLAAGFDRVEWHRDAADEARNQAVMRFERRYDVWRNGVFADTVQRVKKYVRPAVRLSRDLLGSVGGRSCVCADALVFS